MAREAEVQQQPQQDIDGLQEQILQHSGAFKAQLAIEQQVEELARSNAKTKEICTGLKALLMELAQLARDEEEELCQLEVVVENHPAEDAPQMFDESPRPNAYTKSIDGNVHGQEVAQEGVETVPCEQLDGLNPSNGSLAKSTPSIHGKVTSNAQGKQQVYDMEHPFVFPLGFPKPHEGWKEINCDGHIRQLSGVPVLFRPGKGGSYKQGGLELDSAKLSMPKQYTSMLNWFAVDLEGEHSAMDGQILNEQQRNHGWNEANGFCVFVFDPGAEIVIRKSLFGGEYIAFAGLEEYIRSVANFKFTEEEINFIRDALPCTCEEGFLDYLRLVDCSEVEVYASPEEFSVFPKVPLIRVEGTVAVAQLLETTLANLVNYASLVATNAVRHRRVAGNSRTLLEVGFRQAQGPDEGVSASRYCYLGGFDATSNVAAGILFGIPVKGTHSHTFVSSFMSPVEIGEKSLRSTDGLTTCDDFVSLVQSWLSQIPRTRLSIGNFGETNLSELAAFASYALAFPDDFLALVDIYDVLRSGIPNFCAVAVALRDLGYKATGIRLDSGDSASWHTYLVRLAGLFQAIEKDFGVPCLGLVARAIGDIIVPLVMPFVEANITSSEWRCRYAKVPTTAQIIQHPLLAVMNKMSWIFDPPLGKEKQGELQALLCDVLQVIIQKLSNCDETRHIVLQVADQIMVLLLKILACCSSTVHEEAMFSMGALAYATGSDSFTAHVSSCGPFHSSYHSAPESVNSELRTMDSKLCQDDMPMVRRSAASDLAKLAADMDEAGLIAVEILGAFKLAVVRLMFDPGGEFSAIAAESLKLGVKLLEGEAMIRK